MQGFAWLLTQAKILENLGFLQGASIDVHLDFLNQAGWTRVALVFSKHVPVWHETYAHACLS